MEKLLLDLTYIFRCIMLGILPFNGQILIYLDLLVLSILDGIAQATVESWEVKPMKPMQDEPMDLQIFGTNLSNSEKPIEEVASFKEFGLFFLMLFFWGVPFQDCWGVRFDGIFHGTSGLSNWFSGFR